MLDWILNLVGIDWEWVRMVLWVVGGFLLLIALAVSLYVIKTIMSPIIPFAQWLFGYKPGERPNDVTAGLIYGLRMSAWASIFATVIWYYFH